MFYVLHTKLHLIRAELAYITHECNFSVSLLMCSHEPNVYMARVLIYVNRMGIEMINMFKMNNDISKHLDFLIEKRFTQI